MFINFRSVFEFLFKSFDISWDTKLIEKLEKDWVRFLMMMKRHWIYALLSSWRVLVVIVIAFVNIYLLALSPWKHDYISYVIAVLLAINVVYWVFIIIIYIKNYYKVLWVKPYIEDIYSCIKKSKLSDEIFTNFFNQTLFLLFMLVLIAVFIIFSWVTVLIADLSSSKSWSISFWIWILNWFLMLIQIWFFYNYLAKMINIEMDFRIIVAWKIHLFNQKWVFGDTQTMNSDKIKTINTKYTSFFGSFFNFGDIIVLSEWDQQNNWEMIFDYIGHPKETVKEMQKVLDNDFSVIEKEVNVLLQKLKLETWITDINDKNNLEKLKIFVTENEKSLKSIYEKADEETKKEIRELFDLIW